MSDVMVTYCNDVIVMSLCSDYEGVVKLSEDFNGADLRNVCTEAGQRLALPFMKK